jgi:hypothetical protein
MGELAMNVAQEIQDTLQKALDQDMVTLARLYQRGTAAKARYIPSRSLVEVLFIQSEKDAILTVVVMPGKAEETLRLIRFQIMDTIRQMGHEPVPEPKPPRRTWFTWDDVDFLRDLKMLGAVGRAAEMLDELMGIVALHLPPREL